MLCSIVAPVILSRRHTGIFETIAEGTFTINVSSGLSVDGRHAIVSTHPSTGVVSHLEAVSTCMQNPCDTEGAER